MLLHLVFLVDIPWSCSCPLLARVFQNYLTVHELRGHREMGHLEGGLTCLLQGSIYSNGCSCSCENPRSIQRTFTRSDPPTNLWTIFGCKKVLCLIQVQLRSPNANPSWSVSWFTASLLFAVYFLFASDANLDTNLKLINTFSVL